MVSGIVMSLWDLWFMIGHVQLSSLIMGGGHWGIDNYRLFYYFSAFAKKILTERCLHVYMYTYTCIRMTPVQSFLNQTTHSKFMIKNQTLFTYIYHWMRLIRF